MSHGAENWLSIVEYARMHSVSDMTVRRRIKSGKIHAILKDGKYFIPVDSGAPQVIRPHPNGNSIGNSIQRHAPESHIQRDYSQSPQASAQPSNQMPYRNNHNQKSNYQDYQASQYRPQPIQTEKYSYIPKQIRTSFSDQEKVWVKTESLLSFCNQVMKRLYREEQQCAEKYTHQLKALESRLEERNTQLSQLKQQMEDMELLVKILEKK